jgi:hypothetical protein
MLGGPFTSLTFDDDVDSVLPIVATRSENDVRVRTKVRRLLFVASRREMQLPVRPDGHERCDVRSPVLSDRREPIEFR